ncbi:MAG: pyridoxine 5'-phosphate synthase [Candidatus Omnitrophica bacterium]|nr:pyridoxine 5'-phosphate synthase [Candidatus Omnitrophota bacterium]
MAKLGVNIDHVATIRQARKAACPDPIEAARLSEEAGCDSIVCHLREDRRHIVDADVIGLKKTVRTRLNLEMSAAKDIVDFACRIKPEQVTIVPEKRQEVTTEGGLDVCRNFTKVRSVISRLNGKSIDVSLFVNPDLKQIDASVRAGAKIIEIHTGEYANASTGKARAKQLTILKKAVHHAVSIGLEVNAGHGLDYDNVTDVAVIEGINELNIGHSIIARAVFVGIGCAVEEMIGRIK